MCIDILLFFFFAYSFLLLFFYWKEPPESIEYAFSQLPFHIEDDGSSSTAPIHNAGSSKSDYCKNYLAYKQMKKKSRRKTDFDCPSPFDRPRNRSPNPLSHIAFKNGEQ